MQSIEMYDVTTIRTGDPPPWKTQRFADVTDTNFRNFSVLILDVIVRTGPFLKPFIRGRVVRGCHLPPFALVHPPPLIRASQSLNITESVNITVHPHKVASRRIRPNVKSLDLPRTVTTLCAGAPPHPSGGWLIRPAVGP